MKLHETSTLKPTEFPLGFNYAEGTYSPNSTQLLRPEVLGVWGHKHKPDVTGSLKGYLFKPRQPEVTTENGN